MERVLPKDVWKLIGNRLDSYSLWCLKKTCKHFYNDVFQHHKKVKSSDVETRLLQYVDGVTDQNMLNRNTFQLILSDLFRNTKYKPSDDMFARLFSWIIKTLDSPEMLYLLRGHTCYKISMHTVLQDVVFCGKIWVRFIGHFLFSSHTIRKCFLYWSRSTDQAHGKHFKWIIENGISPDFIKNAFDEDDEEVIKAIFYDLHIFVDIFDFGKNYYIQMQNMIDDSIFDGSYKTACNEAIRFLVQTCGFVTDNLCVLLKVRDLHDELVGNICGCCNYQVTKKLKLFK